MEEKNKVKQKQMILMFIGIAILLVSITGITFAFFNYTRTGGANVIKTGNIEFNMTQGKTINLQNVFPVTSEEALADLDLAGMSKKRWHPRAVDIYPAEGGKVAGMEAFLEVNGLTIDGAIAFGGVKNDIEMLERVGTGVAMGNAMDEVKAVADFVTTADRDDGIENALRCFGLL